MRYWVLIAIVDLPSSNAQGVHWALKLMGVRSEITSEISAVLRSTHLILPGVGSFGHASEFLDSTGLRSAIKTVHSQKSPVLGICLGFQLAFSHSEESPGSHGLSLIDGMVRRIEPLGGVRVPNVGWHRIQASSSPSNKVISGSDFYFSHSYHVVPFVEPDSVSTISLGGTQIIAAAEIGNFWGTQFHPEKSYRPGFELLKRFSESRVK